MGGRHGLVVFASARQPGGLRFESRPSFIFFLLMNFLFHSFNPWTPDLLLSEGWKNTTAEYRVCDQWKSDKKIDVMDLLNERKEKCGPQGLFNPTYSEI